MNLPIEIIDEYRNWRKIKDINNNIGWLHKNLIKGERYSIIKKKSLIYNFPGGNIIGEVGKNNISKINKCLIKWCLINIKKKKMWIKKNELWGIYKNETINIPFYQIAINSYWKLKKYFDYNE